MDKNGDITIRLLKVENKAVVEVSDMGVGIEGVELKKSLVHSIRRNLMERFFH